MGGTALKFGDLLSEFSQKLFFVDESGTQTNGFFGRAGDTLAEPQCTREILFGVVDRFEGLRPNALHVPEVKELVSSHRGKGIEILLDRVGVQLDSSGV